ncbi:MAG: adenine phosphoribosyltransferase [Propioniciclava sp.]
MTARAEPLAALLRDVPDWPKPGVMFTDITPLLADADGFALAIEELTALTPGQVDVVVGMEARGFIFAAPVALNLGAGFVPVRKPGKLPWQTASESFALEYGSDTLTMHTDALWPGARVMVVDDVLATGGTVAATAALVKRLGAELVHVAVLVELSFLAGRQRLLGSGIDAVSAVLTR